MGNGARQPSRVRTLAFDILVPHDQPDTLMLYELSASNEAFDSYWNGRSTQQVSTEGAGLIVSLKQARN